MARVPSWHLAEDQPTPAIPEPVRDRTPLSLGLAVNDKKPIAVPSGQGGQVNLLNPNVLAFVHACAFVGPIGREDGDTADDPIHQEWLQSSMPDSELTVNDFQDNLAKGLFDGYDLYYRQQHSSHTGSTTEVDAILRDKWHKLPAEERQQWAKGSAKRKHDQMDPHATDSEDEDIFSATPNKKPAPEQKPDNDDDCVCMDDWKPPPAQSHRQNALEGWMAANGVSAKGKDPAN